MKEITITNQFNETITIRVGDRVSFKCDVEQAGRVVEINPRRGFAPGYELVLENEAGFQGGYIGGSTRTTIDAEEASK